MEDRPETGDGRVETGDWRPETGDGRLETGDWRVETGDWRGETGDFLRRDSMRNYRNIKAWALSDDLTVNIYDATKGFPREEIYGLTSQLRRAAYSVPANITEGASRKTKKDYLHFLYIARGSLSEADYFVHLAHRLNFLEEKNKAALDAQVGECRACLIGLIQAVEKEAGSLGRTAAKISSWLVLFLPMVSGLRSPVSGL